MDGRTILQMGEATPAYQEVLWDYRECSLSTALDCVCDYLLLIIAKKKFRLPQSLHAISNAIGPLLFKQSDIHSIFNVTKDYNNNRSDNLPIQLSLW